MKFHGVQIQEGSSISNLTVASGTAFPSSPNEAEVFYRTDAAVTVRGLYAYIGGTWDRIASADAVTVPSAADFPAAANVGDLFYKNSNDSNEALYVYTGSIWAPAASGSGSTLTVTGDVTGTLTVGDTGALTLASIVTAATVGAAADSTIITYDSKGRITGSSTTPIAIAATQVTTGSFSDARIAQSNVTQHQGALSLAASQTTSGTFADARIAASNVVQHQAALTILESQITDGTLLARNAGNETITGSWQYNNPIVTATPISGSHATTKDYVDQAVAGLSWKNSVNVATTANITLSGTQTIDGVALVAGNRVLVKNQSSQAENGVYVVSAGAWTRATDFDSVSPLDEVNSAAVFVRSGTTQADTAWTQTAPVVTVGSDSMVFAQFAGANTYAGGAGMVLSGNAFNIGTASASRIVINTDDIDLATIGTPITASFVKPTTDAYGRVSATTPVTTADITALVDATYVNVTGDTMTGVLNITTNGAASQLNIGSSSTAGYSYLRFNDTSAVRKLEILYAGTTVAGSTYGIAAGHAVINTSSGVNMNFSTNDLLRMTIEAATGNVGVGASPQADVMLSAFSANRSVVAGTGQIGAYSTTTQAADSGGALILGGAFNGTTTTTFASISGRKTNSTSNDISGYMAFATSLAGTGMVERMRIDNAGNVGVNTTSPSTYGLFSVVNNATRYVALTPNAGGQIDVANFRYDNNGNQFVNLTNLGITGANQGMALNCRMSHDGANDTDSGRIAFLSSNAWTSTASTKNSYMQFATVTSGSLSEKMRLDSAGNLGIGGAPATMVHVKGGGAAARVRVESTSGVVMEMLADNAVSGALSVNTNHPMIFQTNSAERMRIDAAGQFGFGGTPSAARMDVFLNTGTYPINFAAQRFNNANATGQTAIDFLYSGTFRGRVRSDYVGNMTYVASGGVHDFWINGDSGTGTLGARITTAGDLLVGNTSPTPGNDTTIWFGASGSTPQLPTQTLIHAPNNATGGWIFQGIYRGSAQIGSISYNGTGVTYNTTSDSRLKENIVDATSAGEKIDAIRVRAFDWRSNGEHTDHGFIAQELATVVPEAVHVGGEDETSSPWSVDPSKLVALLLKEIQELRARVAALEAK